ncbi:MAG TPA: hypothetical protein VFU85_06790, partial [Nocardioides sp.]|nr:hypothetical protein [Nocardioides sp.]
MPTPLIRRLSDAVVDSGGRAYLVGGAVRAMMMGLPTRDYDVEVFGLSLNQLRLILGRFGPVNEVGRAFSVFKLGNLDVSLPRRDSKTGAGHTGFTVESDPTMTIDEAARRRDFTVNAMSIDLRSGALIDPYGGAQDLDHQVLRAVDPETFVEDPLRVLRAMQFASRLDFTIAPSTIQLCLAIR